MFDLILFSPATAPAHARAPALCPNLDLDLGPDLTGIFFTFAQCKNEASQLSRLDQRVQVWEQDKPHLFTISKLQLGLSITFSHRGAHHQNKSEQIYCTVRDSLTSIRSVYPTVHTSTFTPRHPPHPPHLLSTFWTGPPVPGRFGQAHAPIFISQSPRSRASPNHPLPALSHSSDAAPLHSTITSHSSPALFDAQGGPAFWHRHRRQQQQGTKTTH